MSANDLGVLNKFRALDCKLLTSLILENDFIASTSKDLRRMLVSSAESISSGISSLGFLNDVLRRFQFRIPSRNRQDELLLDKMDIAKVWGVIEQRR